MGLTLPLIRLKLTYKKKKKKKMLRIKEFSRVEKIERDVSWTRIILICIKTKYLIKIFRYKNTYMHQNKNTYTSRDATNSDLIVYCFS